MSPVTNDAKQNIPPTIAKNISINDGIRYITIYRLLLSCVYFVRRMSLVRPFFMPQHTIIYYNVRVLFRWIFINSCRQRVSSQPNQRYMKRECTDTSSSSNHFSSIYLYWNIRKRIWQRNLVLYHSKWSIRIYLSSWNRCYFSAGSSMKNWIKIYLPCLRADTRAVRHTNPSFW